MYMSESYSKEANERYWQKGDLKWDAVGWNHVLINLKCLQATPSGHSLILIYDTNVLY